MSTSNFISEGHNMKIDYVVTFLDPTDPYWLEKFKPYQAVEFNSQPTRYDVDGVMHLKYNFRGIAKYMPWIDNLFLVVFSESQVPKWINRNTVTVITDDMYIPSKFLPTFNTSTKQMHFHRIPNLGEHFIWGDDDQFAINPLSVSSFFDSDGNPKSERLYEAKMEKPKDASDTWENIVYNSIRFAYVSTNTPLDGDTVIRQPALHVPHPALKSDLERCYNSNPRLVEESITPCRAAKNIIGFTWCVVNGLKYKTKTSIRSF